MTQRRNDKILSAFFDEVQKLGGVASSLFEDKKGELLKRVSAQRQGAPQIGSNYQSREMTPGPAYDRKGQGGGQLALGGAEAPSGEVLS